MRAIVACSAVLALAVFSGCASTPRQEPAPRPADVQGSPLLAHATQASLGLTFPAGQATRQQVLQNFGAPSNVHETADGRSRLEFTYTAGSRNCNHRRVLTHTAVFEFDRDGVVAGVALRHGARWY